MNAAHAVWRACIPPMVCLRPDCDDYRSVDRLQATALAFSTEISGGESWLQSSTTPAAFTPSARVHRDAEVDEMIASAGGDPRIAIRTLLDVVERMKDDQEMLYAQM